MPLPPGPVSAAVYAGWNYRVWRQEHEDEIVYRIVEVYYADDAQTEIVAMCEVDSPESTGDYPEDLILELTRMLSSVTKPVITYDPDTGEFAELPHSQEAEDKERTEDKP